jgi:hypothetical protein
VVAHALAGISQDLSHTAVVLETSIAVFNAGAGSGKFRFRSLKNTFSNVNWLLLLLVLFNYWRA